MHIEVQVALNFVISYLYNKLPRRRVNLFGEELEKALKHKFQGHWYPEKPFKGSAFRCLRVGNPIDPVIEQAARESGVEVQDIRENLPEELSVWIDPSEVSYRIGEKGVVKILYSEDTVNNGEESQLDREVTRSFNPEAQCFKPIEAVTSTLNGLSLSPGSGTSSNGGSSGSGAAAGSSHSSSRSGSAGPATGSPQSANGENGGPPSSPSSFKSPTSPINAFIPKSTAPMTFTTAAFAQTKFGSTKLKTSSKRSHRMSPTEFSNYIKQRAMLQQQQQPPPPPTAAVSPMYRGPSPQPHQRPRSLSPNPLHHADPFLLMAAAGQQAPPPFATSPASTSRSFFEAATYHLGDAAAQQGKMAAAAGFLDAAPYLAAAGTDNSKAFLDGINFNLSALPYSAQCQHLLVAN